MTKNRQLLTLSLVSLSFLTNAFGVGSGGYENQVPGARAMARANSVVASIDDATAVSFNPARLTAINGGNISLGLTFQNAKTDYDDNAGGSASTDNGTTISPNFHAASKFGSEKWGFGLGINVPHGSSTDWGKNKPMSFIATETDLVVMDVNPAAAYKLTDKASIGIGINYYNVTKVVSNRQVDFDSDTIADADLESEGDGDDIGANIGFSFSPSEKHFFGISYKTGANVDVEGDLKINDVNGVSAAVLGTANYQTSVKSKVVVPPELQIGYAIKPTGKVILELDAQWNKWSEFNEQKLEFSETDPTMLSILNTGNPAPKDWKNSWSLGLGAEYAFRENIFLRGGYGFLDSPIPNSTFEASTPDSDIHMFTLGGGTVVSNITIDLAAQLFYLNDRQINNAVTLPGKYSTTAQYYGMNIGYKFGLN